MKNTLARLASVSALCAAPGAYAADVYTNDFTTETVASGVSAAFTAAGGGLQDTVAPYSATYGKIFRNSTTGLTELTLSGLGTHDHAQVSFLAAFLDSWDSRNGTPTPDNFDIFIDGVQVASWTYNNASGSLTDIGGSTVIAAYVQFDVNAFYSDTVVDTGTAGALSFAHSAPTLTIGWQASGAGWQGGNDEAWGIDNLKVSVSAVPEPAAPLLMLAGLLAVAGVARRKAG